MTTTDIATTDIETGDCIALKGQAVFRTVADIAEDGGVLVLTFTASSQPVVHTNPDRRADQLRVRKLGQVVTRKEA